MAMVACTYEASRERALRKEACSLEEPSEWLVGGGEMAERIRSFDWSKSPLGPSDAWSPALRTTVGLMMANRFPMLLWWGSDYISLYNDAYIPVLGSSIRPRSVSRSANAGRKSGIS